MNFRALAAIPLALGLAAAQADTLDYSSQIFAPDYTSWTKSATLQQFDPMLGTLQQVTLEIVADLAGSAKAESKNNTPSTITLDLQATLQLLDPNELNTVLVQATPLVHRVFAASARDGAIDFAGTAGVTYSGLATQLSSQASFSDTATLGLFTGTGQLNLPFVALGESLAQGPGNFRAGFTTLAGGRVNVTYSFEPLTQLTGSMQPVPEPTTWALMFAGLAMVLLLTNRRRHGD